jgi:outer membrane protein
MSFENQEITNSYPESKPNSENRIKLLTIVNVVMLLMLLVLYVLFFTSKSGNKSQLQPEGQQVEKSVETLKIAYVNAEVFSENFKLAKKFQEDLVAEQKRLEGDLARRQKSFQDEVQKFQRDANAGSVSADALQAKEKELGRLQQELGQLNETYVTRLSKREKDMMDEMVKVLQDFYERYNLTRGYDLILRYTPIFGMYYANDKYDITQEVLEMINAEYDTRNQ